MKVKLPEGWKGQALLFVIYLIIAWIVVFIFRFVFIVPYSVWKDSQKSQRTDQVPESELTDSINDSGQLSIILSNGPNFEKFQSYNLYYMNRTILVSIKNNGNKFISNCNFYLDIQGDHIKTFCIADSFTLNATEEKYIPIVSYNEAIALHTDKFKVIRLCIKHGGFYNTDADLSYDKIHVIKLRATCKELNALEVACKIWIDQNGCLKLEKL
ncbi:MAG TPA: hypothetical protein VF939_20975 [Puia sp.]